MPLSCEEGAHLKPLGAPLGQFPFMFQNNEPLSQKEWEGEKKEETPYNYSTLFLVSPEDKARMHCLWVSEK